MNSNNPRAFLGLFCLRVLNLGVYFPVIYGPSLAMIRPGGAIHRPTRLRRHAGALGELENLFAKHGRPKLFIDQPMPRAMAPQEALTDSSSKRTPFETTFGAAALGYLVGYGPRQMKSSAAPRDADHWRSRRPLVNRPWPGGLDTAGFLNKINPWNGDVSSGSTLWRRLARRGRPPKCPCSRLRCSGRAGPCARGARRFRAARERRSRRACR